tara:strand:- start:1509 stop:1679 length:171 start_codon:yes stop_codon:yes gene_type:complete
MKALLLVLITASIILVSFLTMVYGWGLEIESSGCIVFGYFWMIIAPVLTEIVRESN